MANTFLKLPLSASVDGKQIVLATTASTVADYIHTTPEGTTSTDEIWLYAYNDSTATQQVTILWGGISDPADACRVGVTSKTGRSLIVDGKLLRNGLTVRAFAAVSGSVIIDGFINRITTA